MLIGLYRSPVAVHLRPAIDFGTDWTTLVRAWVPEALVLAATAFFAHRAFAHDAEPLGGRFTPALAVYVILWIIVWLIAVFLPAWLMIGPLADRLRPLKDLAIHGGIAGTGFAGLAAFGSVLVFGVMAAGMLSIAAGLAAWSMRYVMALALYGWPYRRERRPRIDPGKILGIVTAIGALYWLFFAGLLIWATPPVRAIADAVAAVGLIGVTAAWLERSRAFSDGGSDGIRH